MSEVTVKTASYIQPTVRVELNGELGLTLEEVAKSLNADEKNVVRKANKLASLGIISIKTVSTPTGAHPVITRILSIADAKLLVAKYDNEVGVGYLKYLIARDEALAQFQKAQKANQHFIPQTHSEALRLAADMAERVEKLEGQLKQIDAMINLEQWFLEPLNSHQKGLIFKKLKAAGANIESRHLNGAVWPTKIVSKGDLERVFPSRTFN